MASNDNDDLIALRGNVQLYLMNSMKYLAPAMHASRKSEFTRHLVHTKFDENELISEFNKTAGINNYLDALPAQLSGLMPKIRLFLRQPPGADGKSQPDIPVHFSGFTSATYTSAGSTNGGKLDIFAQQASGRDVGITRFHISVDNKFKFASVQASMELYFRNMADLSQGPYLHLIRLMKKKEGSYKKPKKGEKDARVKATKELAKRREVMKQRLKKDKNGNLRVTPEKAVTPAAKRVDPAPLKAVIGWATSKGKDLPKDLVGGVDTKKLYQFLERSGLTLLLNVNKYSIDFGEQGEVKLSIEMTGYADDILGGSKEASIFTNPWKVKRRAPHPRVRDRTGTPIGITDTPAKKAVPIKEVFGESLDKLNLNDVPRLLLNPMGATNVARQNKKAKDGKEKSAQYVSIADGYLTSLLQAKKNALKSTPKLMARAKIKVDEEVIRHLIDISEEDLEILKVGTNSSAGKVINDLRTTIGKFKKVYKAISESRKGDVYRNFLERIEAIGGVLTFDVKSTDLGMTIGVESKPNPNDDGTNANIETVTTQIDRSANQNKYMTSPPSLRKSMIGEATFAAAGGSTKENRSKQQGQNKIGTGAPFNIPVGAARKGEYLIPVTFIRLGDIIDTAFHSSGFFTHNIKKKDGTFRIVMDRIKLDLPHSAKGKPDDFDLADLPIQLSAFEYFFFEKYVKKNSVNVPLRGFIDDLMKFVGSELANATFLTEKQKFEPMIVPFSAPNVNGRPMVPGITYTKTSPEFRVNSKKPSGFAAKREAEANTNMEEINNYLVLSLLQNPRRAGNPKIDNARGIYHLILAAGRGPVKAIKFSEQDTSEHIRTMNIRDGSAEFPTVPQNATVDLIGSPHFWQGQMIYIDADYAMPNASVVMGIGGYYMVTKVTHDLDGGNFSTKLECRWQGYKEITEKGTAKRSDNK